MNKVLQNRWLVIAFFLFTQNAAMARTIHVPADYSRIEDAITDAQDGDEIIVVPGIYKEFIGFMGKRIVVRSTFTNDLTVVRNTIIEGVGIYNVIGLSGRETSATLIRGFTIRNGVCGIRGQGTHATIEYCIFQNNNNVEGYYQMEEGGAIQSCNGLIQNNIFENNKANFGGALANCNGTIQNNIFYNNVTFFGNTGKPSVRSILNTNKITEGYGGALYNCNGIIRNNTIVDNYRLDPSGAKPGGLYNCKGTIVNNIIYHTTMTAMLEYENNSVPENCLFRSMNAGGQNLTGDPKFVNPAVHDYRLKPDSPCIDAGKGQNDLKADRIGIQRGLKAGPAGRGDGSGMDIGAEEALPKPVAVWLPNGGPPGGGQEGQPLDVAWVLDPPAGTQIQMRLYRAGRYLGELGQFSSPTGSNTSSVPLPTSIITCPDYAIVGVSTATGQTSATPHFKITGTQPLNAVPPQIWQNYF